MSTSFMQHQELSYLSPDYPALLNEIRNKPPVLYVLGERGLNRRPLVAIVGTRRPTSYGIYVTQLFASTLAQAGITIVSGLALGLDTVAHQAALDAGGTTIAVVGSGLDKIYPRSNQRLAESILSNGGSIISEQPHGMAAFPQHIVARNRIVAGMSHATIVTQAAENSGTLHTANFAQGEGRPVFAVPAHITDPNSSGSNDLLRCNVAQPTTGPIDILDSLREVLRSYHMQEDPTADQVPSDNSSAAILKLIARHHNSTEQLLNGSRLSPGDLAETLTQLELTGQITNLGAGHWALKRRRSSP